MFPMEIARRSAVAFRRCREYVCLAGGVVALIALAIAVSGCGVSATAAAETPAPESAAAPASIDAVWPQVGIDDAPLFGLIVTETQGFTDRERRYLRAERIAWGKICHEATEYATPATAGGDPAGAEQLMSRIERKAAAAGSAPSPSPRFAMLRDSVHRLMRRVVHMARLTQTYASASTADDKTSSATELVKLAAHLPAEVLRTTDWGVALHFRYGGVYYAAVTPPPVSPTPVPVPTSPPEPQPDPNPNPNPNPDPNPNPTHSPTPTPALTAAEAKQVAEIEQLDAWLTPIMAETSATVEGAKLPWSEEQVNSFCLNMAYMQDQCALWLGRAPAGSHIAAGFKQYLNGLALVNKGAGQLNAAAQSNDTGHQKALDAGNKTLKSAATGLRGGLSKMTAYR